MTTETTMKQETAQQTLTASAAAPSGPRIYHVGRSVWSFTHVLDTDRSTYLYIIDTNHCKVKDAPGMTIKSAATSKVIGTIQEYALSKTIDLTVNDKPMALKAISAVSTGRVFTSYADPGRKFRWLYNSALSLGLECVDEKEEKVVATWDGSSLLTSGDNFFTIEPEIEGGLFEEIVVSGLAMVEHRAKRNRHGFGGAVAAGLRMAGHPFQDSSK